MVFCLPDGHVEVVDREEKELQPTGQFTANGKVRTVVLIFGWQMVQRADRPAAPVCAWEYELLLLRVKFRPGQSRWFFQAVILNGYATGSPLQRRLESMSYLRSTLVGHVVR